MALLTGRMGAAPAAAVTRLLDAVLAAGELGAGSVRDRAALLEAENIAASAERRLRRLDVENAGPEVRAAQVAATDHIDSLVALGVDRPSQRSAAAMLATTIDEALPALTEWSATAKLPAHDVVDGCDVRDLPPLLCVGSEAENHYRSDYALVVDRGGNDTHSHSAGGADPLYGLPASVTLDMGGDDTYVAARNAATDMPAVQGAGHNGGIGFLVDNAGNDSYRIVNDRIGPGLDHDDISRSMAPIGNCFSGLFSCGQGVGIGGVGVLADYEGRDDFTATDTAVGDDGSPSHVWAQGVASGGGLALSLNFGTEDDTYDLAAAPTEPFVVTVPDAVGDTSHEELVIGPAAVYGYGFAQVGGAAIFVDAGGTDVATMRSATAPVDAHERRPIASCSPGVTICVPADGAGNKGIGYAGFGAFAMARGGHGNNVWSSSAVAVAPTTNGTASDTHGTGAAGSTGILHDLGGDDTYSAVLTSARVAQGTPCESGCSPVRAAANATSPSPGSVYLQGMGRGAVGGVGVLLDEAGNDRYEAVASSSAEAIATGSARAAIAQASSSLLVAQGAAIWDSTGELRDLDGDDIYIARAESASEAVGDKPTESSSTAEAAGVFAQASLYAPYEHAHAQLFDGGGVDRYLVSSGSVATGSAGALLTQGTPFSGAQAWVGGVGEALFVDSDGGAADVFESVPTITPCQGDRRGAELWRDCSGAAVGVNR